MTSDRNIIHRPTIQTVFLKSCLCCLCGLLFYSCSTTKYVPDGDQLFIGLKDIEYLKYEEGEHFDETQEEIEAALATKPNGALFGSSYHRTPFPYGLWVWNATNGSDGKFAQWLNRTFGKAPVLMSQVNPALRASVAQSVLRKHGYLHGSVTYEEITQKNPKKAKITYRVTLDSLFLVDTMSYEHFPAPMKALIDSTLDDAYIKAGTPLSVANLDAERTRLSQLFRNNGYYYYQPNFASYLADTFDIENRAKLRLQLADSLPADALRPWYVGHITMNIRRSAMERMDSSRTFRWMTINHSGKHSPLRPGVILSNMKLFPRQLYGYDNYVASVQGINATGVFSSIDMQFQPRQDSLDMTLNCTLDKPYDVYFEANAINRTIGRAGPELRIGFTKRNAFHGAEKLDVNLHGAYEWQTTGGGERMNSYQYGIDASIEFPRIMLPWSDLSHRLRKAFARSDSPRMRRRPRRYFTTPTTIAKVSSDIIRRPAYYKMHIVTGEWTYRWQPSETSRHEFSPLTLKYQYMNSHTERFEELMDENSYLAMTMDNQFIPKIRYTYTYASPKKLRNPIRWETTIQESGNLTALYDVLIQGNSWNQKDKTLFKNPYSQFLKIETDFTKTWTLGTKSQLVGHVNYGLMWSYGNSTGGPFSELFYAGGANSIRAFPVHSIGPGGFSGLIDDSQFSYMMQNGDMKLIMNLELRQRLFGNLYGAVFLDAGNVWNSEDWTIKSEDMGEDADDPDAQLFVGIWNALFSDNRFRMKNFLDQVAVGTGIGLRYDLDFLVIRADWGFGLHLPYMTSKSGYFNIPRFRDMHTFHLAIGYPF